MSGEGKSAKAAQGAAGTAGDVDLRLALRARRLLAELWKIPAGEVNGEAVQALSAAIVAEGLADLTTQPGRGAVLHAFAEMARHVCEPDGDGDGRAHDRLCGAMLDAKREWTDIEARLAAAEAQLVAAELRALRLTREAAMQLAFDAAIEGWESQQEMPDPEATAYVRRMWSAARALPPDALRGGGS